jgi:hypothetical protein
MKTFKPIYNLFRKIQAEKTISSKVKLLQEFRGDVDTLKSVFRLVYEPLTNSVQIPDIDSSVTSNAEKDTHIQQFIFAVAKDEVLKFFEKNKKLSKKEIKLYSAIAAKNLNLNLCMTTLNWAFPGLFSKLVHFMKGVEYDDSLILTYPLYLEPKINGIRIKVVAQKEEHSMKAYNQNMNRLSGLFKEYIKPLTAIAEKLKTPIELDGVLETPSKVYNVFDFVMRNKPKTILEKRKNNLIKVVAMLEGIESSTKIKIVPFAKVTSKQEIYKAWKNLNAFFLKKVDSPYSHEDKPSFFWMEQNGESPMFKRVIVDVIKHRGVVDSCLLAKIGGNKSDAVIVNTLSDSQRILLNQKNVCGSIVYCLKSAGKLTITKIKKR